MPREVRLTHTLNFSCQCLLWASTGNWKQAFAIKAAVLAVGSIGCVPSGVCPFQDCSKCCRAPKTTGQRTYMYFVTLGTKCKKMIILI